MFTGCGHEVRRLFEGGVTNAKTLAAGGDYSRAVTIRGRRLIDEIRYVYIYYSYSTNCPHIPACKGAFPPWIIFHYLASSKSISTVMDLAKQSDLEHQHLYCSSIHRVPKLDERVTIENEKTTSANHPFYFISGFSLKRDSGALRPLLSLPLLSLPLLSLPLLSLPLLSLPLLSLPLLSLPLLSLPLLSLPLLSLPLLSLPLLSLPLLSLPAASASL